MKKKSLAFVTRAPIEAMAKTRLAKSVGDKQAHRFYMAMLEDFFANLQSNQATFRQIVCAITPHSQKWEQFFNELAQKYQLDNFIVLPQKEDGFFQRLGSLINEPIFCYDDIHLTGSDVINIPFEKILQLTEAGESCIGPDQDSGFYYSVISYKDRKVFERFDLQSKTVFNQLEKRLTSPIILPLWRDIDTYADLILACDRAGFTENIKKELYSYQKWEQFAPFQG